MNLRQRFFNKLLSKARFMFVYVINFQSWSPFKTLEVVTEDGRQITFSILHNRRKKPWYDFYVTYLVYVNIHKDNTELLTKISNQYLLTIDVLFGYLFNDNMVATTILNSYLDRMIDLLEHMGKKKIEENMCKVMS